MTDSAYLSETYQQRTHRDQILEAPDSYIGSIQPVDQTTWVATACPTAENPLPAIDQIMMSYHPGLYKLVDEAIVNCRDQYIRMIQSALPDKKLVTYIHVSVDPATGSITMENDGDGIDVAKHPETDKWIPEMIFTNLLTSTNYNKDEKRITGGKNGLGIKLVMIWSTYARIETVDHRRKLRYVQEVHSNMAVVNSPIITKVAKTVKPMTRITFIPDYARLGLASGLSAEMIQLFAKRTMDICGTTEIPGKKLNVRWNDVLLPIHKFQTYVQLYQIADAESMKYEKNGERWEYAVTLSPDNTFHQISFVNGIATFRGGRHVDFIVGQITDKLCAAAEKKKINIRNGPSAKYPDSTSRFVAALKRQMSVFVRCDIENPSFDSQTKEYLTTQISQFGSTCEVSASFITKMLSLGFLDRIQQINEESNLREHKKTDGVKKKNIKVDKLDDANLAGTARSAECTLFLVEGDSAKISLLTGMTAKDKDIYGVYPVGGKMLNVINASTTDLSKNKELNALKTIMGLETFKTYTAESARRLLRYGRIVLLADQDLDGSHVKGLELNAILNLWPSLGDIPGFLAMFDTPIIKATKGNQVEAFYNHGEFSKWEKSITPKEMKRWSLKYYKGLGTSTSREFKEYMRNPKIVNFQMTSECMDKIKMVFQKNRVSERKAWMQAYDKHLYLNTSNTHVTYTDFIDKELVHFSIYSCARAIPNVMDGLKTGQRKTVTAERARPQTSEIKVAQLAGLVSQTMDYLHGETSLAGTIVGEAQVFLGANNIAYFQAIGQFGTRCKNGADAASPRYIFTKLEPITWTLFREEDDAILTYLYDGNTRIEPEYYCPPIPTVLVNGSSGIGTGFSSTVPTYNPLDLVQAVRDRLQHGIGVAVHRPFVPYYEQFKGRVVPIASSVVPGTGATSFLIYGCYHRKTAGSNIVCITELPVGTSTEAYEALVDKWVDDTSCPITEFKKNNTELSVYFELVFSSASIVDALEIEVDARGVNKLEQMCQLVVAVHTSNMYLFDAQFKLTKYNSPDEIIDSYFPVRLDAYVRRRAHQLQYLRTIAKKLENKARYIQGMLNGTIDLRRKTDAEIDALLLSFPLDKFDDSFQYLTSLPMNSVSTAKVDALQKEFETARRNYQSLEAQSPADLWEADLVQFEAAYRTYKVQRELPYIEEIQEQKKKEGLPSTSLKRKPKTSK